MKLSVAGFITLLCFIVNAYGQSDELKMVANKPEFPGGDVAMYKFFSDNIQYPPDAKELKKQGRTLVSFVILADGVVDTASVSIFEGFFPSCDVEAVRVVKGFPRWTPGSTASGETAKVRMVIPVLFKLPKEKKQKKRKRNPEND